MSSPHFLSTNITLKVFQVGWTRLALHCKTFKRCNYIARLGCLRSATATKLPPMSSLAAQLANATNDRQSIADIHQSTVFLPNMTRFCRINQQQNSYGLMALVHCLVQTLEAAIKFVYFLHNASVIISLIRMRSKRDIKMGRLCTPGGAVLEIVGGGVTFRFLNGEATLDENMLFWVRLYALVVVLKILLDFRL